MVVRILHSVGSINIVDTVVYIYQPSVYSMMSSIHRDKLTIVAIYKDASVKDRGDKASEHTEEEGSFSSSSSKRINNVVSRSSWSVIILITKERRHAQIDIWTVVLEDIIGMNNKVLGMLTKVRATVFGTVHRVTTWARALRSTEGAAEVFKVKNTTDNTKPTRGSIFDDGKGTVQGA